MSSLVLLPMLLGITYLARIQDVGHASEMAARYVAFDALNQSDQAERWRELTALQSEVRLRFFGDPLLPITTATGATTPVQNMGVKPFMTLEDGSPMLGVDASNVTLTTGTGNLGTGMADGFSLSSDAGPYAQPVRSALRLRANGIHTINVNVEPRFLGRSQPGQTLFGDYAQADLRIRRSMSALHSGWAAESRDDIVSRITGNALLLPSLQAWPELRLSQRLVPTVEVPGPIPGPRLTVWRDIVQADRRP